MLRDDTAVLLLRLCIHMWSQWIGWDVTASFPKGGLQSLVRGEAAFSR